MPVPPINKSDSPVSYESFFTYEFQNHFHPYVGYLIQKLNKGELEDLLDIETQKKHEIFFEEYYEVNPYNDEAITVKYFDKKIDFDVQGPYSIYNTELFYHIPLAIAVQLTKNQRFQDAQRWFHFIFNPLTNEKEHKDHPTHRYWKYLPFREGTSASSITSLLEDLSDSNLSDSSKIDLKNSIAAWRKKPFSPHEVAKFRPLAYQYNVVMKYLDMLIGWGDSLFRQFTIETINQATQQYVIAKNVLGPRPQKVPSLNKRPIRNYNQLKQQLDAFGNAMIEMENEFPLNSNHLNANDGKQDSSLTSLLGIGRQLYFCIPENKQLLSYWDTVEDRLFKIRNCMDIEGNVRQLPLFQPPIDPGMLVKAAAGGIDIGSIAAGLNQPVSNVRFQVIVQKALELTAELKSMGNALLSAIEKGDNEKLALIRQEHEIKMLGLSQDIKYLQWKEAEAATAALVNSREAAYQSYRHYQLLLGKKETDFSDLEELTLERKELTEENFEEVYASIVESYDQEIDLENYKEEKIGLTGEATNAVSNLTGFTGKVMGIGSSDHLQLNKAEDLELNVFMPLAHSLSLYSGGVGAIATMLSLIPQFKADVEPLGVGAGFGFGGRQLSASASFASQLIRLGSEIISYQGTRAAKLGAHKNRDDERVFLSNQANRELRQIGKQVITALIREQSLKKDYENHKVQIEQSQRIDEFLKEQKYSNEELYLWMQGEISKTYFDCYKLAFDTAKKAEITMKHELMRKELNEQDFIKFNYWDAGRKGLLSGEALFMDIKRMELAYLEHNKREFEITKHISLQRLDPLALLTLKATGTCTINIPEWLFDLDCPGHYMRRIKSVSLSIPCIVGPYTSVNCTLSLQKSSIRTSSLLENGNYARNETEEDIRFRDYYGAIQSIVTSTAQNDSGLFELNFRDERFLPFEGSGTISTWRLELPSTLRQFDYNTINDVILHMKYTARQAGGLKTGAIDAIEYKFEQIEEDGLVRLFNLKHDFPNEWHRFVNADPTEDLKLTIRKEHFPYLVQGSQFTFQNEENNTVTIRLISIDETGELSSNKYPDPVTFNYASFNNGGSAEMKFEKSLLTGKLDLENGTQHYILLGYGVQEKNG
ncbi:Tc toxin subunit A-related protein [Flavilitoribacter nigricans]|uniref:Toxin n=1 Tax=Flavilitoribacter nigricans (strain ATCC 23147 / DSM 23189 / NBRC 102662 / NCIMB 1420 / SS-2) TaxID=1122177 RepID=A0A2D0MY59_FLAN2|nr:toxin [Flavilitoribacter nigricans]PHN01147.1 toxin [Flavilitoribacter nigricans DSM 23189 = NBRC 102662]